jgi:hypothetical protein
VVKTGIEKIKVLPGKGADRFCNSCRRLARNRVTFKDNYKKVILRLCNTCAKKEYEELLLGCILGQPKTRNIDRKD